MDTVRVLRFVTLALALLACAAWGFLAVTSYPIIVIADSDLGSDAMERVRDASSMFLLSLAVAGLATHLVPWPWLRLGLAILVLGLLASLTYQSDTFPHSARWPSLAILGLVLATVFADARHLQGRPPAPLGAVGLGLLLSILLVLTDWRGRVSLGLMPTRAAPADVEMQGVRRSVGLLDWRDSHRVESTRSRLRAIGTEDGTLTVEGLDGGPAFRLRSAQPDRMLQVLNFSPDGRLLAVADNHQMYEGSAITIWEVTPGDAGTPPAVVLRRTLGGLTHWTSALDFFPDGRTLVAANGDRTVRLWDVGTGAEVARLFPHRDRQNRWELGADCVAAAPDGRSFATWGADGIKLWDRESQQLVRVLDARGGLGCWLAFTPDGNTLIAADRTSACCWDLHPSWVPFLGLLGITLAVILWLVWACLGRSPASRQSQTSVPADTAFYRTGTAGGSA
jgi:hypothetical protein